MLGFLDKISAFEQTQFWKRVSSVWNLILYFTNKYCKNEYCGQDRDPLFKHRYDMQDTDMTCKIENCFCWLVCFHYQYFRTQKLKNVVFQIKQHVWADTVLKRGCIHTETLLSEIGTGFYWLICINSCWKVGVFSF